MGSSSVSISAVPQSELDTNSMPGTPSRKCEIFALLTDKLQIGLTGLPSELYACSDGAWTRRQDTDIPSPARNHRASSK